MRKLTHGEFRNKVYDLVGDEYYMQGKYVNCRTKMLFKHNACQNTFEMAPETFVQGHRCPYCYSRRIPWAQEKYEEEVFSVYGDEYCVKSEYINCRSPIRIRHIPCGTERTYKQARSILKGNMRCKCCSGKKIDK